jgi:hypothetical protein
MDSMPGTRHAPAVFHTLQKCKVLICFGEKIGLIEGFLMPVLRPPIFIIAKLIPKLCHRRQIMPSKLMSTLKSKVITSNDVRLALFVLTLVLFLLGAGAPSDGGGAAGG